MDLTTGLPISQAAKTRIKRKVGDFIKEQSLQAIAAQTSPIEGGKWKKPLSTPYSKEKKKEAGNTKVNLENRGDLLDDYGYKVTEDGIEIGHFKGKQAAKSDGHNNFSGASRLPTRQYLPEKGQSFKFQSGIEDIIANEVGESIRPTNRVKSDLRSIASSSAFWAIMRSTFPDQSRAQIRLVLTTTPLWFEFLQEANLLRFIDG